MKANKRKGTWQVTCYWRDAAGDHELLIAEGLSEYESLDILIEQEKAYEGTDRAFSAQQVVVPVTRKDYRVSIEF